MYLIYVAAFAFNIMKLFIVRFLKASRLFCELYNIRLHVHRAFDA